MIENDRERESLSLIFHSRLEKKRFGIQWLRYTTDHPAIRTGPTSYVVECRLYVCPQITIVIRLTSERQTVSGWDDYTEFLVRSNNMWWLLSHKIYIYKYILLFPLLFSSSVSVNWWLHVFNDVQINPSLGGGDKSSLQVFVQFELDEHDLSYLYLGGGLATKSNQFAPPWIANEVIHSFHSMKIWKMICRESFCQSNKLNWLWFHSTG